MADALDGIPSGPDDHLLDLFIKSGRWPRPSVMYRSRDIVVLFNAWLTDMGLEVRHVKAISFACTMKRNKTIRSARLSCRRLFWIPAC